VPWVGVALLVAVLLPLSGRTLLRNAVWASAVTVWSEAAELAPQHPAPRTVLAESLQIAGRRDEAIEAYQIALQLDPLEDSTYLKLGMCLAEAGRFEEAAEVFEALRQVSPDSPFVSTGLGIVAMLAGETSDAREQFRLTIERHPRDTMARQWLAVLEEEVAANPAEALRLCEEVRQIAPGKLSDDECVRRNQARLEALSAGSF
jgi:Flp pilus assembly protein TadD